MANKFTDGYKTYDTSNGYGNKGKWRRIFEERMSQEESVTVLSRQDQTPWEILGIPPGSTEAVIKTAFRKLIKEWHPDMNPSRLQQADAMSKTIIAAYSKLTT